MTIIVASLSFEDQNSSFLFEDRDKNIRDVLVHLHEWHEMLKEWYQVGVVENGNPLTPAEGYNWRQLPELNQVIWQKYQETTLEEARELLDTSHMNMLKLIESHSNEELFSKKVYPWTKSTTLGAYFVSNTSSHYIWAQKKIKKQIRLLN